ncbi:hypothetical protein PR048_001444 [Dryococelus australis]|uniref:Uncharacterized protein n=1 Tax=Dryococelus australis TaxID=614101 RepID=A0ABQ9IHD2_9NEOP|nr:hypothetical protein PR048_001444 [Dryococelus australis]
MCVFFADMNTESFTKALRRVELPIVPREECQQKLRLTRLSKYFMLHKSFMCSGGKPGKDTCKVYDFDKPPSL